MRIRDLDMPPQSKLDTLSLFLVEFYLKNIITTSRLKKIYEIYYKFKQKFLSKYPGMNFYVRQATRFNKMSCKKVFLFNFRCQYKHVWFNSIWNLF